MAKQPEADIRIFEMAAGRGPRHMAEAVIELIDGVIGIGIKGIPRTNVIGKAWQSRRVACQVEECDRSSVVVGNLNLLGR